MWLNIKTEYSFRQTFGPIDQVAQRCKELGATAACISDLNNTFGHVPWHNACKKVGLRPVYGVTLSVVPYINEKEKISNPGRVSIIALTDDGLQELYSTVYDSYEKFYYVPRIGYEQVNGLSADVAVIAFGGIDWSRLSKPAYGLLAEGLPDAYPAHVQRIAGQQNVYVNRGDVMTYELVTEQRAGTRRGHLLSEDEWSIDHGDVASLKAAATLLDSARATIRTAPLVAYPGKLPRQLELMCKAGAQRRGVDLQDPVYKERLERELELISQKNFEDYFLVVADMIDHAKHDLKMLVGPSRGSSAGSLVCYLTGITEIDPIPFGLLFERFIDINRADLPDIDIDFPDSQREQVIDYLNRKYGAECVAHVGTVSKLMPRSAIGLFAKGLGIPAYETKAVKDGIIERSSGDARAAFCIEDTFTTTDAGRALLEKYPRMSLVANAEGHARHAGVHAAGIIVCNEPITHYCGVDARQNVAMVDKGEAESIGLLKIDVLGLRTLSILQDCCAAIGMEHEALYRLPLEDEATFELMTSMKLAGVFQFEGYALQSLARQMGIRNFNDIVAITSLARPGPLHSGGATLFIERRTGRAPVEYFHQHAAVVNNTKEEYGTIIYQEQVMQIGRQFGGLSWEDVSALRKAMSKSLGEEFFAGYKKKFVDGAVEKGVSEEDAGYVWENMETFGSMGFNKSHAVSYGLLSYWCAYLKTHYPLEFARANLNHAKDLGQSIKLLREFGFDYVAIDPEHSTDKWTIHGDKLIGPLTNIKGLGPKICADIIERRAAGKELTKRQRTLLSSQGTALDELYPAQKRFGEFYKDPLKILIKLHAISYLKDVQANGTYVFFGRLMDRNLRDLNEYGNLVKRGGRRIEGQSLFLNFTLEDDTDSIICTIERGLFLKYGKEIAETGRVGEDWYLVYGRIKNDWRKIFVEKIERVSTENDIAEATARVIERQKIQEQKHKSSAASAC